MKERCRERAIQHHAERREGGGEGEDQGRTVLLLRLLQVGRQAGTQGDAPKRICHLRVIDIEVEEAVQVDL